MRTDSKSYSNEFINSAREYILKNYSDKYVNDNNNTREKGAKEAHEAIRPTDLSLKALPETVDSKDRRLYKLIWVNTLASCMSNAIFYSITANISSADNTKFSYTSEEVFFDGFKTIEKIPDNKEYQYLQTIQQNVEISYKKIIARATIKGLKQHYTEARLIQLLEERGIGRPSTFSSLVDKIQERGYVKKTDIQGIKIDCSDYELENGEIFELQTQREFGGEKNKLVIQSVGIIVNDFLYKHFPNLFDYDYTMQMENELDKISNVANINIIGYSDASSMVIDERTANSLDRIYNPLRYPYKSDYFYERGYYPNLQVPFQALGCGGRRTPCLGGTQVPIYNPPLSIDISERNIAPVYVSTRGPLGKNQQLGVLYKVYGDDNDVLPLFGRRKYPNDTKYEYYTLMGRYGVKLPIIVKNKNYELGTNDIVFVKGLPSPYRVTIYESDFPSYIPYDV
jgi:hypothetical protein